MKNPMGPRALATAVLCLAQGRLPDAHRELTQLIKLQPHHWEARLLWAWTGAQTDPTRPAALKQAEALAAEDPADPRALRVLIECLKSSGRPAEAADQQRACRALLKEPGAERRVAEFIAATRGSYLPTRRIGRLKPEKRGI